VVHVFIVTVACRPILTVSQLQTTVIKILQGSVGLITQTMLGG